MIASLLLSVAASCGTGDDWAFRKDLATPVAYHAPKAYRVEDRFGLTNDLETVRADLDRFFASAPGAAQATLRIRRGAVAGHESYRVEVASDGSVTLTAEDADGVRRGVCWVEDRMAAGDLASCTRKPWLRHRISRCYFSPIKRPPANRDELMDDVDYYPDAYLNRLAHEGVNGIWLTADWRELAETSLTARDPTADRRLAKLRRTVSKCARYGIRVWLFGIEPNGVLPDDPLRRARPDLFGRESWYQRRAVWCPSNPDTLRYIEESVRDIFTRVPGLGGILLIANGERPTTCLSSVSPDGENVADCPRCAQVPAEVLFERTAAAIVRGIRAAGSSAEYMGWLYHPQTSETRADWVSRVPAHVPDGTILAYNFESGALVDQLGKKRHGGDYWQSFAGPSDPFARVAAASRMARTPLAAKIQVGCSHECATLPYVPVPGLLYRKYRAMRLAGVSSVLQCWYFGNYPGVMNKAAGELAFETFEDGEDAFLMRLAAPDWREDAGRIASVWKALSDAYANYPMSNMMQYYGPFHAGLAWPLQPEVEMKGLARTWKPDALGGDIIGEALENHTVEEAAELARRMTAIASERSVTASVEALAGKWKGDRERTLDLGVIRALQLHFASAAAILGFYRDRAEAIDASRVRHDARQATAAVGRMQKAVEDEIARTREILPLAEADSRLGFHSEAEDCQYSPAKLRARLDSLAKTRVRLAAIGREIAAGAPYPMSAFEKGRPVCPADGTWIDGARAVRFNLRRVGDDLAFAVRYPTNRTIHVQLLDAAGAGWYRTVEIDAKGARSLKDGDVVLADDFLSQAAVTPCADGSLEARFTVSTRACGGPARRPSWIRLIDYSGDCPGIWPADRPTSSGRLRLGGIRPECFARISGIGFESAKPVWPANSDGLPNENVRFAAVFQTDGRPVTLRATGATQYKIRLDGEVVGYGPARAPEGWARVSEIPLAVAEGRHELVFEVSAYNVAQMYCNIPQPGYLQAEVVAADGTVLAATAKDGAFRATEIAARHRKAPRFSTQRGFVECWTLPERAGEPLALAERDAKKLTVRRAPEPELSHFVPLAPIGEQKVRYDPDGWTNAWGFVKGEYVELPNGYPMSEHVWNAYCHAQRFCPLVKYRPLASPAPVQRIEEGRRIRFDAGADRTGFVALKVKVLMPGKLWLGWSEILMYGDVDPFKMSNADISAWEFTEPGEYAIETLEPYALRYLEATADGGGEFDIASVSIRLLESPEVAAAKLPGTGDGELDEILAAARRSLAANTLDTFMDCPGRERAAWLCDSFFSSKGVFALTGNTKVEKDFLENWLLPEKFGDLPDGMLPMTYPSCAITGTFIPNWAMWYVLELEDYLKRSGDRAFVDAMKPRMAKLVEFFRRYRNSDGLLERLPSWVFIEWSIANLYVQDVSYPANMTWMGALEAYGRMYGDAEATAEAAKMRETIFSQSFDGSFFRDHAKRWKDGSLTVLPQTTETCQNYALYFRLGGRKTPGGWYATVLNRLGGIRPADSEELVDVGKSTPFIGDALRLLALSELGEEEILRRDLKAFFLNQARRTGTLWETERQNNSNCHGFAGVAADLILRCAVR